MTGARSAGRSGFAWRRLGLRSLWGGPVLAVAAVTSACGDQSTTHAAAETHVSQGTAMKRLYRAVDARPTWATAQDRAAVQAASSYAAGSNARCGYSPEGDAELPGHFVCSLRYLGSRGQPERLFFTENARGSNVAPLTHARLAAFVAYERSRIKHFVVAYQRSRSSKPNLSGGLNGLGLKVARQVGAGQSIAGQMAAQPRASGRVCGGAYGMSEATPAVSILTPGSYLTASARTSCKMAQVVATAFGDSSERGTAVLSVPDRATGGDVTLRCHALSNSGPVKCVGRGATVVLGSDAPPVHSAG